MNGDDGYADAGGGGSVWCDFHISETDIGPNWQQGVPNGAGHRPRKVNHAAYKLTAASIDKFTQHAAGNNVQGKGPLNGNDPLIADQGEGYFVLTIDNAAQIQRIEIDGNTLRIYVPVVNPNPAPPPGQKVRQVSLRWGLRASNALGNSIWAALRTALLATPGVANVTGGGTIEKPAASVGN